MADSDNHDTDNPETAAPIIKTTPPSLSNRSAAPGAEPVFSLYNTATLHQGDPFKTLYSSPFVSIVSAGHSLKGKVKKLRSIFESPKPPSSPRPSPRLLKEIAPPNSLPDSPFRLPGTEDRVVIFFTSLRGIRRTFHDCQDVRAAFRGLRANVDERDVSMDFAYRKELQRVLGEDRVSLPQVFVKGKYVGGADVVMQLVETGEMAWLIKGLPTRALQPCDGCGDARFVPCADCSGSKKVFDEEECRSRRCVVCNENGLLRCTLC